MSRFSFETKSCTIFSGKVYFLEDLTTSRMGQWKVRSFRSPGSVRSLRSRWVSWDLSFLFQGPQWQWRCDFRAFRLCWNPHNWTQILFARHQPTWDEEPKRRESIRVLFSRPGYKRVGSEVGFQESRGTWGTVVIRKSQFGGGGGVTDVTATTRRSIHLFVTCPSFSVVSETKDGKVLVGLRFTSWSVKWSKFLPTMFGASNFMGDSHRMGIKL